MGAMGSTDKGGATVSKVGGKTSVGECIERKQILTPPLLVKRRGRVKIYKKNRREGETDSK